MSYVPYHHFAVINSKNVSLNELKSFLTEKFKNDKRSVTISTVDQQLELIVNNWKLSFHLLSSPEVRDFLDSINNEDFIDSKVIEMRGSPDPDMEYFNDSIYGIEALESLGNVTLFNSDLEIF